MGIFKISDSIYYLGVQDWERELFDELIPLPQGTSYNSYFVKGSEKTALIDTADPTKKDMYISNLKEINPEKIDYLIANHAEQDHSGLIPEVLSLYPDTKVVTNEKCKAFLMDLLLIPEEKFLVIKDEETLSLGDKNLKFYLTPWVHWPETMITYLVEDKILFPCDFLASHIATSKIVSEGNELLLESAKRYYSEIMMPFRVSIVKHLKLLDSLDIKIIAPSHGVIYINPSFIINAYKDWVSDKVKAEVVLIYLSMHGSVLEMVNHFERTLIRKGINYKRFDATRADIGEVAMAMVDAATLVLATPVFLSSPHPNMAHILSLINALRPKTRNFALLSSYSWGQRIEEQIKNSLSSLKANFLGSIISKGYPKEKEKREIEELAEKIEKIHKEDEFVIK